MPFRTNAKTAYRGLFRRKTKNLSAILAIFLGVTLLIGVQITSATLRGTFLTSLTLTQGEVDMEFSSGTTGGYLNSTDYHLVANLTPNAVGIMPILLTSEPVQYKAQLQNSVEIAGIQTNYSRAFGEFYDLQGNVMNLTSLLPTNNSVIISKALAKNLGMDLNNFVPGEKVLTQFQKTDITGYLNLSSTPIPTPVITNSTTVQLTTNLTVNGIYDSRPGIGSQTSTSAGRIIMRMSDLQNVIKYTDPQIGSVNMSNIVTIPNPLNATNPTIATPLNFVYNATDKISTYYVAFKTNHFKTGEMSKTLLQTYYNYATKNNPKVNVYYANGTQVLNQDGSPKQVSYFTIASPRLTFYQIADFIYNLLNTFLTILGVLIITTGLLLITNIQLMSVEDREFQTGVLRAVGDNKKGIIYKYLFETIAQGLVGGFLGLFGGLVFGWTIAYYLAGLFGTGTGSVVPVVPPDLIVLSLLIGVVIAIATGILPAIRASNVNIVEALRGIKTSFSEKSSRNFVFLGIIIALIGLRIILTNGFFDTHYQYIWESAGWNTIAEQQNIILGLGLLASGVGIILTRYIDRVKALNITAITLWILPIFTYLVSLKWVDTASMGDSSWFLLITIIEVVIGSVMLIGLNLAPLMEAIRNVLIKFNFSKGVAQVAPNLIKSHKTRSTLTFAIFAVILTLNVLIATMVATQENSTIGKANADSRGVDLTVSLNRPSDPAHPYANLIKQLDSRITDVIPFRTCVMCMSSNTPMLISTKNPASKDYNPLKDVLPLQMVEVNKGQIIGNVTGTTQQILSQNWRYDFYLSGSSGSNGFPEGVREKVQSNMNDNQLSQLSKEGWLDLFNSSYKMTAYNLSSVLSGGFGGFTSSLTPDKIINDSNGNPVKNPIIFTDSFLLPVGSEIWIPMNGTGYATKYQAFTVGGRLDSQRAGGFPFSPQTFGRGFNDINVVGDILMPAQWTQYTSYLGNATEGSIQPRSSQAFDKFMIKTSLSIDSPGIKQIASEIETFTNTPNSGYRKLIGDELILASATTIYSVLEQNLQAANQIVNFLQIYVSFGLVIGALGMAIIAVRNVAERKREIGMMRAIGFPRGQVMFAVLLELFVLGIIGLIIGIVNGFLIGYGLSKLSGSVVVVPWGTIAIYLGFITLVAVIAGALPGWFAARIPASEALRYVG